ncbi:relaxase domain-containing protein [Acidithiobacillus sp.]|uniref:relaxase domain-containing protein n=1 Tax=Acidithiobacillus sp. TaxID=1872118 RepID=UPI0023172B1B|nr:relaxase domain-containing protein [Acidithiobacillus sp.]MDA8246704.1 relaxase domain-containing protein [Acidithiobacillus sp.]
MAQRMDGAWGAIESWEIYRHKMALDALYRAVLAQRLQEMSFCIEQDGESFRILGVSDDTEREFSRRRQQIEKLLLERGHDNAAALAALIRADANKVASAIVDVIRRTGGLEDQSRVQLDT